MQAQGSTKVTRRSPPEAFAEAERRIAAAKSADSTFLDLKNLGLIRVPESIGHLAQIKTLLLSGNRLTVLPDTLSKLNQLERFDADQNLLSVLPEWITAFAKLADLTLYENRLTSLPKSIGRLERLQILLLSFNQLTSLPQSVWQLRQLDTLNVGANKLLAISDGLAHLTKLQILGVGSNLLSTLPDSFAQLKRLRVLNASYSLLTTLPESICELACLESLSLENNHLTSLPTCIGKLTRLRQLDLDGNDLVSLPESLRHLESLQQLFLHDNPQLLFPASLLGPDKRQSAHAKTEFQKPRLILDYYFRTRTDQNRRPLREAKLILVGRGEVGKTSLVKRLVENRFTRREDRTQGIRITQWPLAVKRGEEVRMHVWDFGGQEIMHATHQFFLTDRSVYMLVLDGRGGQQEAEADYWLRIVTSFAPESPVLVVLNKMLKDPFDLNRRALQDKYPRIKAFVETDCDNTNAKSEPGAKGLGIDELRKAIARETNQLPDLRAAFPAAWFEIKEKLSKSKKNFLPFDEYRAICTKYGEQDEGAQESLATHLHRLGIALNFREDRRLRDTHVLNPHWVTEGIYGLLNSARLAAAKGELRVGDMKKELNQTRYPERMHQFLLDLMEKFELCFSFPTGGRYLIPELLDPQQPKEADKFDPAGCLNFQYHYPVLPAGLLPRFIVRTHVLSEKHRWRTGVILNFEGNTALVKADLQERRVFISIDGPVDTRRRMLAMIREDFEAIHNDIQHLNPAEMVPLPNHPRVVVPYRDLEVLESNDADAKWQQVIERDVVVLPVRDLLNGVDLGPRSPRFGDDDLARMGRGRSGEEPLLVFYSYAHVDSRQRLSLKKHLSPLRRLKLITDWYDHDIDPGDEWAEEISQKLNEADIVLLLISADFVDSNYCYDTELAEAMKKHEAGTAEVIPIIVRPTNAWTNLPFGKLNALPYMGKPIPKWPTHDEGWTNVAAGVERVARQLLARRTSAGVH
jgi:internalin A